MKEVKFSISGMHCTGCSSRLERVLNGLDGVSNANVEFDKGIANIKFDDSNLSISEILDAIKDAGFDGEQI